MLTMAGADSASQSRWVTFLMWRNLSGSGQKNIDFCMFAGWSLTRWQVEVCPKHTPAALLADKGYDADAIRADLAKRTIEAVIPAGQTAP